MLIKEWMSRSVITLESDKSLSDGLKLFKTRVISMLPVLEDGKLAGIITKNDIFRCFVSFTGVSNKGQVFAFKLQDKPGIIKYLTEMIRNSGGRLGSILTSYDDLEEGFRKVFFHTFDIDPDKYDRLVENFYGTGNLLYAADLSRGFRKIF